MRRDRSRISIHEPVAPARSVAGLLIALALAAPGAALAQDPPPSSPASGKLTLRWERVLRDRGARVALRGDTVRLAGALTPAVAGQRVRVRVYRGKRKLLARSARVRSDGTFRLRYRARTAGALRAVAVHVATARMATVRSRRARLRVLVPRAGASSRGPLARLLQSGLARLGYAVPRSGVVDGGTQRAIMAWRKVNGRARNFVADEAVLRAVLRGRGAFKPRHPKAGRHLEADISRQVLALIGASGKVERTYHTSTGAPATPTIRGSFRVYMKTPGTNSLGMVHSAYFHRGYAVHGFASVPPYNASHGCLRVPVPDARYIYDWLRHGTRVIVYP